MTCASLRRLRSVLCFRGILIRIWRDLIPLRWNSPYFCGVDPKKTCCYLYIGVGSRNLHCWPRLGTPFLFFLRWRLGVSLELRDNAVPVAEDCNLSSNLSHPEPIKHGTSKLIQRIFSIPLNIIEPCVLLVWKFHISIQMDCHMQLRDLSEWSSNDIDLLIHDFPSMFPPCSP